MKNNIIKVSRFELAYQLNNMIGFLNLKGLSEESKANVIDLKFRLSDLTKEIVKYRNDAFDALNKPAEFFLFRAKMEEGVMTDEDKEAFKEIEAAMEKEFTAATKDYFNEVVEVPFEGLSKADFTSIIANNDIEQVFGYEYIYDRLVNTDEVPVEASHVDEAPTDEAPLESESNVEEQL